MDHRGFELCLSPQSNDAEDGDIRIYLSRCGVFRSVRIIVRSKYWSMILGDHSRHPQGRFCGCETFHSSRDSSSLFQSLLIRVQVGLSNSKSIPLNSCFRSSDLGISLPKAMTRPKSFGLSSTLGGLLRYPNLEFNLTIFGPHLSD
jgi:hypothetical protein